MHHIKVERGLPGERKKTSKGRQTWGEWIKKAE